VEHHISDAVKRGASILHGGQRIEGAGSFYTPTILGDVPADAAITTEETFGPVAPLIKFETEEEVLALANATDVGLAGYFFSRDIGRVWRVAEAVGRRLRSCVGAALTVCACACSSRSAWSARTPG
jgi:succinate-semialdehyde dehydrogenase/glutarate-semialdehyde dehydrogenase